MCACVAAMHASMSRDDHSGSTVAASDLLLSEAAAAARLVATVPC